MRPIGGPCCPYAAPKAIACAIGRIFSIFIRHLCDSGQASNYSLAGKSGQGLPRREGEAAIGVWGSGIGTTSNRSKGHYSTFPVIQHAPTVPGGHYSTSLPSNPPTQPSLPSVRFAALLASRFSISTIRCAMMALRCLRTSGNDKYSRKVRPCRSSPLTQ